jgi:hypothetical protein
MPKAKFADRGKAKPKSQKTFAKLTNSKRKLSRFGGSIGDDNGVDKGAGRSATTKAARQHRD